MAFILNIYCFFFSLTSVKFSTAVMLYWTQFNSKPKYYLLEAINSS
jgi:hypothetical protein